MKNFTKILTISLFSVLFLFSCNSDDESKTTELTTQQKITLLNDYIWVVDLTYVAPSSKITSAVVQQNPCAANDYLTFNVEEGEGGLIVGDYTLYEYNGTDIEDCIFDFSYYCFTYNPTTNVFSDYSCEVIEMSAKPIKSSVVIEEEEEVKMIITNNYIILDGEKFVKTPKPLL